MRIIDANLNRAKEGMRVCEEICRFHLNLKVYAQTLNRMRHSLTIYLRIKLKDNIVSKEPKTLYKGDFFFEVNSLYSL